MPDLPSSPALRQSSQGSTAGGNSKDHEPVRSSQSPVDSHDPATAGQPPASGKRTGPDLGLSTRDTWLGRLNRRGFRLTQGLDVFGLVVVLVTSMVVRHGWDWPAYPMWLYTISFFVILSVFEASFYFGGLYEREPRLGRGSVIPWAARQSLVAGGIVALGNPIITGIAQRYGLATERALPIPTLNLIILIVVAPLVVAVVRWLSMQMRTRREGLPRVVLLGTPSQIEVARAHLDVERARVSIVATASRDSNLMPMIEATDATDLILLSGEWSRSLYPDLADELERLQVSVLQRITAAETLYGLPRVRQVGGLPLVLLRAHVMPRSRAQFKRLTDLGLLAVGAPVWLPMLALLAAYTRVTMGSPVFFRQDRVGARGELFRLVKFRTMTPLAEEDGNPRLASRDDPRILPAARWMRATRMDELPQVVNIARGEMSLVGPRPERPEMTAKFELEIPGYARRHEVPPGLTGLAQIHGHYHTNPEYKLGYDLQYVSNWSPLLDFEILLRTVWVVVSQRI